MATVCLILTQDELKQLVAYKTGKHATRKVLIATALLMLDEGEFTERH